MLLKKQKKNLKIAVCIPTYKRDEYTKRCLKAIKNTTEYDIKVFTYNNDSLRTTILQFFSDTEGYDIIAKIDNDCMVPCDWMYDLIQLFDKTDIEIISPNVYPSNAALKYGRDEGLPYMPSDIVGGLWCMKRELIQGIMFHEYPVKGITGAFNILKQIINEKEPVIGWAKDIIVQDVGHWSGKHPEHIKSDEHRKYSQEVGRKIGW